MRPLLSHRRRAPARGCLRGPAHGRSRAAPRWRRERGRRVQPELPGGGRGLLQLPRYAPRRVRAGLHRRQQSVLHPSRRSVAVRAALGRGRVLVEVFRAGAVHLRLQGLAGPAACSRRSAPRGSISTRWRPPARISGRRDSRTGSGALCGASSQRIDDWGRTP